MTDAQEKTRRNQKGRRGRKVDLQGGHICVGVQNDSGHDVFVAMQKKNRGARDDQGRPSDTRANTTIIVFIVMFFEKHAEDQGRRGQNIQDQ